MSVKEKTLEVLENNRGQYISGGELANALSVSRNAVWKAVKSLEQEGYAIDAVKNRGYRLAETNDILSEQSIRKYLTEYQEVFELDIQKSVTSTNALLKEQALQGAREGTVLIAEEQTSGKGKTAKGFYSPKGTGIYMSLLLRPDIPLQETFLLTTASAVAVAEAIETVSSRKTEIRWVNDVYCDGKKVSGILTEASYQVETCKLDYVIIGTGIHVKLPEQGLPEELKQGTDCVFERTETDVRSQLVAEVLMRFWNFYVNRKDKLFLEAYQKRFGLTGKQVSVQTGNEVLEGKVKEINRQCHLILELHDGSEKEIAAGMLMK